MRLTGLASGLDIDSMVQELMAARRKPYDNLFQKKTTMQWQREQYREVSAKLVDFSLNKLSSYSLSSAISAKKAQVTGSTTAVSSTATSGAATGTMTVSIAQLATATRYTSSASGGLTGGPIDLSSTLQELKDSHGLTYTAVDSTITLEINGTEITLNENEDTMATLISKINSKTDVNAVFDSGSGKLSLTTKETGAAADVAIVGDVLDVFDLEWNVAGEDAVATVNGLQITSASNKISINGVELTFLEVTDGSEATISVGTDTEKIMDTIKSFINDYNEVLNLLNGKVNEERYRTYQPLTTEQKAEMKDSEIELWEERAKSGLLQRDSILTSLVSNMRLGSISNVNVDGVEINLTSLGITTGAWEERGKLVIKDEAALRDAIEDNPEQVMAFFTQKSTDKTPAAEDAGLFTRLTNSVSASLKDLAEKAGTSRYSAELTTKFMENSLMGEQLLQLERRMDTVNSQLLRMENQYYKQFAAMESAINKFNSQAGALASFMA
ncbi:flagellar filament capping protein FliD [Paenibacillus sp. IB182496]|uniref:Flagellar hook-associated protein 2 n=1 Tax=Paenibacillus sabuli TaxID=2772509 RepID=A0A927BU69_9BACL|nr:flagellar filament capping protein FliD [Paenibacillus sabuli]MBD2845825.1 flagellar filament capping protein FliD [Paenibacillus sabuli]